MWSNKKPETPQAAEPEPRKFNFNEPPKPATATLEGTKNMATGNDAIRPLGNTGDRTGTGARLGSSLHVKGEISGNEDLLIDGTVEGLITLDERKLTVGASAKVTADIIAREVVVYGTVKGNLRAKDRIEIKQQVHFRPAKSVLLLRSSALLRPVAQLTTEIVRAARARVSELDNASAAIVMGDQEWPLGVLGLAASPPLLIKDLGRPERFLNMLRMFKITSPMSVGSWILSVSGASTTLAAATVPRGVVRRAGGPGSISRTGLCSYTRTPALAAAAIWPRISFPGWRRQRWRRPHAPA